MSIINWTKIVVKLQTQKIVLYKTENAFNIEDRDLKNENSETSIFLSFLKSYNNTI